MIETISCLAFPCYVAVSLSIGLENALVSETNSKGVAHGELRAVGFWMTMKGANPIQPVRVFISYEALPTSIRPMLGISPPLSITSTDFGPA
jgi:hypothetical protein